MNGASEKDSSGDAHSALATRSGDRPGTPGGASAPDPDLEVLSREGAADIRAMTDFTCPMRVIPGGAVEGKTLSAAGLRGLPGLFLTAVQTGEETDAVAAPGPSTSSAAATSFGSPATPRA